MIHRLLKRGADRLLRDLFDLLQATIGIAGQIRAKFPSIRRVIPGQGASGSKHAVYVHYDRWGVVHDYILQAVAELVAC